MPGNLQDALRVLSATPVKQGDPPTLAAASWRMQAITDAIQALARGDNIGRGFGIRKRVSEGSLILTADIQKGGTSSTIGYTPFLVYPSVDNTDPPYPILKVYPGKIAGQVPTLAGAELTVPDTAAEPHPWFYPPGTNFSFFLRVKITADPSNLFRPFVEEVKVTTDDESSEDIEGEEIPELKMFWDNEDRTEGHFYIRIADIEMTIVEGNIIYVASTQWLFTSYSAFAISDIEAIIVI